MSFIRIQTPKLDSDGNYIGGSASILESVYVNDGGKFHCRQKNRESLGQVVFCDKERKCGIFLSKQRGLVAYDSQKDEFSIPDDGDPRLGKREHEAAPVHTVFGDSYLLMEFMRKNGYAGLLRNVFDRNFSYERILAHLIHDIAKDGSRISCSDFISKSFSSYILDSVSTKSLRSDSAYFDAMGDDDVKVSFFRSFVSMMRKKNKDFGKACYVDSTPLPNDIADNPFNALCSHGTGVCEMMSRLVLVLDDKYGLPVWYDFIGGSILDVSTIMKVVDDVKATLDITIDSLVLDAGYVSKEMLSAFASSSSKTLVARMPARKGYPFRELYSMFHREMDKGKYAFVMRNHTYFGQKKEMVVQGVRIWCYVYVDKENALMGARRYMMENAEEYSSLSLHDKDWTLVKYGYFVLVANYEASPEEILSSYFSRAKIEEVFKTAKSYIALLPLSKWTAQRIKGKILSDMIALIITLNLQKELNSCGESLNDLWGACSSLMCIRNKGEAIVETASKRVKELFSIFSIPVPASVRINDFKKALQIKV